MSIRSQELREKRSQLISSARVIIDKAEADERELTEEEQTQIDAMFAEADEAEVEADNAERKEKLEELEARQKQNQPRKTSPSRTVATKKISSDERAEAFRTWALAGCRGVVINGEQRVRAAECGYDVSAQSINFRALSKGTDSAGGYSVPEDFTTEYERKLAYYWPVKEAISTFKTTDGRDMPFVQADDSTNNAAIVGEGSSIGSSSDPTFSQVVFKAWKYASPIVKVSQELLQDSSINIQEYLAESFAERFGRGYEAAVVSTNAGSSAPQGLLNGVSAGVNLASGNAITLAKLIDLEVSVDIAYRNLPSAGFIMHDATWAQIRQLADDQNFPIFMGSLQEGVTPRLLGYPVYISNQITSISSPGDDQPLILFGALSKYRWRTCSDRVLTRLDELYAATGQVGFVMLERADGRYIGHSGCVKTLNSYDAP